MSVSPFGRQDRKEEGALGPLVVRSRLPPPVPISRRVIIIDIETALEQLDLILGLLGHVRVSLSTICILHFVFAMSTLKA